MRDLQFWHCLCLRDQFALLGRVTLGKGQVECRSVTSKSVKVTVINKLNSYLPYQILPCLGWKLFIEDRILGRQSKLYMLRSILNMLKTTLDIILFLIGGSHSFHLRCGKFLRRVVFKKKLRNSNQGPAVIIREGTENHREGLRH